MMGMIIFEHELNELEEPCETTEDALRKLDKIAELDERYIFRGLSDASYKLNTTYYRYKEKSLTYKITRPKRHSLFEATKMLNLFRDGLVRIGKGQMIENFNFLDLLEYARHYGLPSPLLDFTRSPYIALYFAFNDIISNCKNSSNKYVKIIALHIDSLAWIWDYWKRKEKNMENYNGYEVFYGSNKIDSDTSEVNALHYIKYPGRYNSRMQRQMGVMIYDTMEYTNLGLNDLEGFIKKNKKLIPNDHKVHKPILNVIINKNCAAAVFKKLEIMGINTSMLFLDEAGVAKDAMIGTLYDLSKNYIRK